MKISIIIPIFLLALSSCSGNKNVYVNKIKKTPKDYKEDYFTSSVKIKFFIGDTFNFSKYGFATVVINKVPISADSAGQQFQTSLYPGKFKFIVMPLGPQYQKFTLRTDPKYNYELWVELKKIKAKKGEIL